MTLPTPEHVAELSQAELVALVTELIAVVQRLAAENQQLKVELEKMSLPPPTSQNFSQPPSREVKRTPAAGGRGGATGRRRDWDPSGAECGHRQ